jgi:anti-anti-sigma factor
VGQDGPGTVTVMHRDEGCAVVLRGEFDLACHATLGSALDNALRRNVEVLVDLSGVTFLDGSCVRELALLLTLHGERLVLEGSSREVEVSVTACGMEDLVRVGRPRLPCLDTRVPRL